MNKKILVTGAAGFFGSHLIEEILVNTSYSIVALCRMSTIGDMDRILSSSHVQKNTDRIQFVYFDLKYHIPEHISDKIGKVDYIVHAAANSHVDRSLISPKEFFEDNVIGTVNLLEWYRFSNKDAKFINFLTDEVFGPAPLDYDFKENDRWRPSNPYSASKAGQGAAGISYYVSYGLPIITTYTMNIFGERQNKEKLVAKAIHNLHHDLPITIHAKLDENGIVEYTGERHWLHARNASNAVLFLLQHGIAGEHYNIVGDTKLKNEEMVMKISEIMNKTPKLEYIDFHKTRPGHDRRYALSGEKLKNMGWKPPLSFDESLIKTVNNQLATMRS